MQVFTCGFITLATIFMMSHFFGQCVQLPNTWMADSYGFAFTCPSGADHPPPPCSASFPCLESDFMGSNLYTCCNTVIPKYTGHHLLALCLCDL